MADATHGGDAAHHGAEAASGMPQLDFATFPSQIFWLLVSLAALYYILSKVALPRIAAVIEERHDAVEDDLDRAADYKRRAETAEREYAAALADAKSKANAIAAEARAEVQKELDAATEKAEAEISARASESEKRIKEIRDGALVAVEQVANDAALALVERLAPDAADAEKTRAAVSNAMQG